MTSTLTSLLGSASIEDHEEVLKAANVALKTSKIDEVAAHTRVVAYLKLDRYSDALRALDEGGDKLAQRCVFEKAYALYKTGELEKAEETVRSSAVNSRGLKHVAAQVAYRAESFEDAAKIYKDLSVQRAGIEGEENDLRINSSAVDAQLEWQGNGDLVEKSRKTPEREDLEAFETAYNAACGYIARGELGHGSVLLKRARQLCEALDELTDEEKMAEVLPIMVQQAYVFTKLGKFDEAEALQTSISVVDVPEAPTKLIAQNNAIAAKASPNPYIAQRLYSSIPTLSKTETLFAYQAAILQRNKYVLDLQALKNKGVAKSASKALSSQSATVTLSDTAGTSALHAAAHIKSSDTKTAIRELLPLLEKSSTDVGLVLTIVQLYILTNNPSAAINLLESFFRRLEESSSTADQDVCFAPGLVALAVSLYKIQGRTGMVKSALGRAASYWRSKSRPSESLYRAAGVALLESSFPDDLQEASEIFTALRKQDPKDKLAIAGTVASQARSNFPAIKSDSDKLTPIERLIAGVDVDALEAGGIASLPVTMSEASKKRSAPPEKEKTQKKRKSKLPKDYEEGKQADPERWLPLKDRSTYRPKGKKGKRKAMDSTQGGVVKEEENSEVTAGAGKVQQAPSGKSKKKKGKK